MQTVPGKPNQWAFDQSDPRQSSQSYEDIFNRGIKGVGADQLFSQMQGYGDQFAQTFKQMTGGDPTQDDYNKFYSNIVQNNIVGGGKGFQGTNYADVQNLINPYLQNQYGSQIQGHQQQQQQQQMQTGQKQIQDLINQQNQSTVSNLTSPQVMEQFKTSLNNSGLLNSGAFSTQLADRLAQGANQNQSAALGGFGLPAIGSQYASAGQPFQSFQNNQNENLQGWGQGATGFQDFINQSQMAQQLQKMMQPSQFQQWAPVIQGLLQGSGSALSGGFAPGGAFA